MAFVTNQTSALVIENRGDLLSALTRAGFPSGPDVLINGLTVTELYNRLVVGQVSVSLRINDRLYQVIAPVKLTQFSRRRTA